MEEWKCIPSFPDHQASNLGNIKSFKTKDGNPRILKPCLNKKTGYLFVAVSKTFKQPVHYFVTRAWFGEPPADGRKWDVNHKNLNKLDNKVENLEYVTRKRNSEHAVVNGAYANHTNEHWKKGRHDKRKFTREDVEMIRALSNAGFSNYKIGQRFGVNHKAIEQIVKGISYKDW